MIRRAAACALIAAVAACGGAAPPTSGELVASAGKPCLLTVTQDERGAGATVRGEGFAPDRPVVLEFRTPGRTVALSEAEDVALRTDARGVFLTRTSAGREDVGPVEISASTDDCAASTGVTVTANMFLADCVTAMPAKSNSPIADQYRAMVLVDDPIGYWRFEDADGTVAHGDVGSDGVLEGGVTLAQPGVVTDSRSVHLDGTDEWIDIDDVVLSSDFTVEAWIFPCGDVLDAEDSIVGQAGTGPDINLFEERPRLWDGGVDRVVAERPIDYGRWVHVAVTRHGSEVTVFLDGVSAGTGTFESPFPVAAIGYGNGGRVFEGRLDEVAIYDHALAEDRLAAHVAATR
jgi:hypothetical protein